MQKPKSVLDDDIIVSNDNEQLASGPISRSPIPSNNDSSISSESPSSSPRPPRKGRRLSDIY